MTHEPAALDRRAAWLLAAASVLVLGVLAVWLIPWSWVPGGNLRPLAADELFTPAEIDRAEQFATLRRTLSWSSYAVSAALALLLGFTPLGARLLRRLAGGRRWWLGVVVGTLALLLLGRLITLPFALLIRRQNLEYDLTRQDLAGWGADRLRSLLVAWILTAIVMLVIVGCLRLRPRRWFLWAGGALAVLTVAGSFLYPVTVEPLFNRFTALPDGPLRTDILEIAAREGVAVDDVLVADASRRTTTLNAYVSGIGSTRRVVLYDTLLDQMGPAEVKIVVAHELAHAKHNDVLVGTALAAVGGVLAIALLALLLDSRRLRARAGVRTATDPAVIALILGLAAVASFVTSPVVNTVSRAVEARADRVALASTGESEAFVRMQRQLALESVQDPTPPVWSQLWFGSHPTVLQRAGLPRSLKEAG